MKPAIFHAIRNTTPERVTQKHTPNMDRVRAAHDAEYMAIFQKARCRNRPEHPLSECSMRVKSYPGGARARPVWSCSVCGHFVRFAKMADNPNWESLLKFDMRAQKREEKAYQKRIEPLVQRRMEETRAAWFADHNIYLSSPAWATLRAAVIFRDGGKCALCESPGRDVHHLTYERWQGERLTDLTLLCAQCHRNEHGK